MILHMHIELIRLNLYPFYQGPRGNLLAFPKNCKSHLHFNSKLFYILWSKETPPPGGVSYLLCSLIKSRELEDPPRRICTRCFEGGPLTHGSWWGNIINRKLPQGGGLFRSTYHTEKYHTYTLKIVISNISSHHQWQRGSCHPSHKRSTKPYRLAHSKLIYILITLEKTSHTHPKLIICHVFQKNKNIHLDSYSKLIYVLVTLKKLPTTSPCTL